MPERIQLRRTKGWRKPEGAVVVARPSRWGNPYRGPNRGTAVTLFAVDLMVPGGNENGWDSVKFTVDDVREELAGRDLCCWCPLDHPCHADVLLAVANGGEVGRG